jgi:hypothetical protein
VRWETLWSEKSSPCSWCWWACLAPVFCMISFVYSSDLAHWGLTAGSPGSTFCLLGPVHLWANRRPRVNAKLCTCHREAMEDSPAWS